MLLRIETSKKHKPTTLENQMMYFFYVFSQPIPAKLQNLQSFWCALSRNGTGMHQLQFKSTAAHAINTSGPFDVH